MKIYKAAEPLKTAFLQFGGPAANLGFLELCLLSPQPKWQG
jgi:hypothetical protein